MLFLGHNSTHHDSARFAPMLRAALKPDDIDIVYTEDTTALNPATLAKYDALMIYANHTTITPDQEKALLDYVAGGKGFLPIHSASFCFRTRRPTSRWSARSSRSTAPASSPRRSSSRITR